jgi:hypothetical protein
MNLPAFADLLVLVTDFVQSGIDSTLLHRLPTSSLAHSWLVFREKDIPLVAKDNVALVHIDRAKSCYWFWTAWSHCKTRRVRKKDDYATLPFRRFCANLLLSIEGCA